jgi:hypothetical protein
MLTLTIHQNLQVTETSRVLIFWVCFVLVWFTQNKLKTKPSKYTSLSCNLKQDKEHFVVLIISVFYYFFLLFQVQFLPPVNTASCVRCVAAWQARNVASVRMLATAASTIRLGIGEQGTKNSARNKKHRLGPAQVLHRFIRS